MMFMKVTQDAFYTHVNKLRAAAQANGHTFNRRVSDSECTQQITYEVNGIPNAQAVKPAMEPKTIKYYVLR